MRAFAVLSLLLLPCGSVIAGPPAAICSAPTTPIFSGGVGDVHVVRVTLGRDGESHFEDSTLAVVAHPFFQSQKSVEQALLGEGARSSLVAGPANMVLPMRASPKTLFLELSGSSVVTVASGEKRILTPGMIVIFDDAGSKSGHGGRTGPCGYAAISLGWTAPETAATATPR